MRGGGLFSLLDEFLHFIQKCTRPFIHSFIEKGEPLLSRSPWGYRLRGFATLPQTMLREREREREIFEGLITNNAFSSGGGLIHCSDDDVVANQRYYELLPDSFRCRPILARSGAMSCATGLLIPGY